MDLSGNPMVAPAVRITVLLRLVSEGFQDAFGAGPSWLELPAADLAELRRSVGSDRVEQLTHTVGLREGNQYQAGGPGGTALGRAGGGDRRGRPLPGSRRLVHRRARRGRILRPLGGDRVLPGGRGGQPAGAAHPGGPQAAAGTRGPAAAGAGLYGSGEGGGRAGG